ncbi:MAG TPA: L,D-transpeptidase [Gemmatimonadaceae bacterium]|nr:L,D-transpeptidase [Gemmatimonadaceae bacterium]
MSIPREGVPSPEPRPIRPRPDIVPAQQSRGGWKFVAGAVGITLALVIASGALVYSTLQVRFQRDINRIVFNRNWELLDDVSRRAGTVTDSLQTMLATEPDSAETKPYIVVSIEDRRLWYKFGDTTLYTTQVAVGSGKTLVQKQGTRQEFKFDTPRGRLVVQSKEMDPVWVPPNWHYVEQAKKKGLGILALDRKKAIPGGDGTMIEVDGNDVVKRTPDGVEVPLEAKDGHEITAGGNIIVPPYGTNQRKYKGTLGGHRLNMGDGYALHGTDEPLSIGKAVSHGCVRLRNEDIAYLYSVVPVGTAVFIY